MRKGFFLITLATLFCAPKIFGQSKTNQIEISPSLIWDSYPTFKIRFNSVTNSTIKLQGISWGIGMNYKYSLKTYSFIKMGLGYYKYSFNKIESNIPPFGINKSRIINYRSPFNRLLYSTNKYWHNTITATIGFERQIELKKSTNFIIGLDAINYFSFSQRYNIPGAKIKYKKAAGRYFGFSFIMNTGLQKNLGKFKVGPNIDLPIYRLWKQDEVFPNEKNSKSRSKWVRGIGIGFTCSYLLRKK